MSTAGHRIPSPTVNSRRDGPALWRSLAASDTGRAAGMAAAVITANVIALVITVVFARDAGRLRLRLPGGAHVGLHHPDGPRLGASDRRGARGVAAAGDGRERGDQAVARAAGRGALVVAVLAVLLRAPIAAAIGVDDERWAAAAVPVTAVLWMIVAVDARRAPGLRPVPGGRDQHRRRGPSRASSSGSRSWDRPRRDRRLPRHPARARGGGRRARRGAAARICPPRRTRPWRGCATCSPAPARPWRPSPSCSCSRRCT